jgi:ABC-type sugar transport system ATPase subunit
MIEITDLVVRVGDFELIVDTLVLSDHDWCVMSGPSGSGKTLLLETIAGFYKPSSGTIMINGVDMTYISPEKRDIGIVFQDYSLFPHMTVRKNISYGLRLRRYQGSDTTVLQITKTLGIDSLLDRYPSTLSGGEKQRVAIARALVVKPALLLLDEPASALDIDTKRELWRDICLLFEKENITILHVTHDVYEAENLGTHKITLKNGKIMNLFDITNQQELLN